MRWRPRGKKGQEGQAMVETALMMLVIILLLMGIIQFGFIFYAHVRVSNAAREGARAGSLWLVDRRFDDHPQKMYYDPTLCDRVDTAVKSEVGCVTEPPEDKNCDITIELATAAAPCPAICPDSKDCPLAPEPGQGITVTVQYDFDLPVVTAVPVIRDIISSPYPVSRTVVMRFQ